MNDHYIKEWTIPFYHGKINDWNTKKNLLLSLYDKVKDGMFVGDQHTDYNSERTNDYINLVHGILIDDIQHIIKKFNQDNSWSTTITSAWFQRYEKGEHHRIHNHGSSGFSMVCFINYDRIEHEPTTFVCPFLNIFDGNVLEYVPEEVEEGSYFVFPSIIKHYVPPNQSNKHRLILSCNINFSKC